MLNWTLKRVTSPSGLAVSLSEAKTHLRVSGTSQDDHITLLIQSATERLERDTNRAILSTQWQQAQHTFPSGQDQLVLNMGPATSVSSITYVDDNGDTQTLDSSLYTFSQARGVVFIEDSSWPSTDLQTKSDKVFINFVCGSPDADCVPRLFKQAILLETGRAYFDPAQENTVNTDNGKSYELIVRKLLRTSYP